MILNYEWADDPKGGSNIAYNVENCFRLLAEKYSLEDERSGILIINSPEFAGMCWRTNTFFQGDLAKKLDLYGCPGMKVSVIEREGSVVKRDENEWDPVSDTYDEHYDDNVREFVEKSRQFKTVAFKITHMSE